MKTAQALYRDPAQNGLPDKPATNAISRLVNIDVVMAMQAGFGASEVSDRWICYSCQTGKAKPSKKTPDPKKKAQ